MPHKWPCRIDRAPERVTMSYQSIPTTSAGADAAAAVASLEGGEQPLELSQQESNHSNGSDENNDRSRRRHGGGALVMTAALVSAVLLAFLGGRASSSLGYVNTSLDDMNNIIKGKVPNRLCEIYHRDPPSSRYSDKSSKTSTPTVRSLIETSLGEPSQPWREVPCIHRYSNGHRGGRVKLLSSLLSSYFSSLLTTSRTRLKQQQRRQQQQVQTSSQTTPPSSSSSSSSSSGTSQRPSAIINVDFTNTVFPNRQPILGFGGAFTEASALNFWSLSEQGRKAALELLFGKDGLGYSLGRTHINSCDFSVQSYSFDNTDDDFDLKDFDDEVTHDLDSGMVDMMLLATKKLKESYPKEVDYGMRIIASPWSPPAWMKRPTNMDMKGAIHAANMTGSADGAPVCLRDGVGSDSKYAKSWALYFSKFVSAYSNHGIDFYGVTVQNEPEFPAPWEACAIDITSEGDFIANHLGPTLAESHPNTKILIFDHNKDHMVKWAQYLLKSDDPASKYIGGTAHHWYAGGMDRLLDGAQGAPNMHRMLSELDDMEVNKDHVLINSEACHCPSTGYAGGDMSIAWARASRNVHTMLADLAAGSNGFIEWNLILDSVGGPNHLGNMCDSPLLAVPHRAVDANGSIPEQLDFELAGHPFGKVHGDTKTREELNAEGVPAKYLDLGVVVQPMYYYVGHISRFVRPGSRAVRALVDGSVGGPKSRTFRPTEVDVPGGGINDLARVGIEATLWPCEGSTRQEWLLNDERQLQVFGHDWLGVPTTSCLGKKADKDFGGLLLTSCNATDNTFGYYEVVPLSEKDRVHIVLQNSKVDSKMSCLVVQPLRNNGGAYGARGGAQVNIGSCEHPWAEWVHDASTGEIYTTALGDDVCLTTGWPFLQAGAFDTSVTGSTAKVAVILNEAGEAANYVFRNNDSILLTASVPPHSVQTVTLD